MPASARHISTRIEVTAARQQVDVLILGSAATYPHEWHEALEAALSKDDGTHDSIAGAETLDEAIALVKTLNHPFIVVDLQLVEAWGVEKLAQVFDAAGPISAVAAISEQGDDDAYARMAHTFIIDDYRIGAPKPHTASVMLYGAREQLFMRGRLSGGGTETRVQERLKKLNRIGLALSKERELGKLLALVLRECRGLMDADAGSIYILESAKARRLPTGKKILGRAERKSYATAIRVADDIKNPGAYKLRFAAAQNDSKEIPFKEIVFPANMESIAGYTALRGEIVNLPDVYQIPADAVYKFNPDVVDKKYGYRCVSMLSIPMRNMRNEVVGVIQLINKKKDPLGILTEPENTPSKVQPFEADDLELALSLGNQAGTAIENVRLYDSISTLFESFVHAAVRSIEQRDPSTAGHSARVDRLTLGVADLIRKCDYGVYKDVTFSDEEMVELHYASMLHDVGKIGVREHILTKANKLFPGQEETLKMRGKMLEVAIRERALQDVARLLAQPDDTGGEEEIRKVEQQRDANIAQLRSDIEFVFQVNKPGFMNDAQVARLEEVRKRTYNVSDGVPNTLLMEDEYKSLAVRKGSLNDEERKEIESHVSKSRVFLEQIPWTHELAGVPQIAGQHHEKMNGKGYPDAVPAAQTPLQSRIMAVADVFDSLTAGDRPYKPAIPLERAIEILQSMAKFGDLDPEVVKFFIDEKVWEKLNLKVLRMSDANDAQRNAQ